MRTLLTAPYVGEIGWELMAWQARVRRLFREGGFDRLVVLGAPGKAGFYADMPLEYRPLEVSTLPGVAYEDRRYDPAAAVPIDSATLRDAVATPVEAAAQELRRRGENIDILWPRFAGSLWPCCLPDQQFVRFERPIQDRPEAPWVVMVQRTRSHNTAVNWPAAAWEAFATKLHDHGIHTTVFPCDSEAAIQALSHCDVAVGYSTGGLHLASLCGCPHVVWGVPEWMPASPWQISTRQRYQTFWNPLATPVHYYGMTAQPDPEQAVAWVLRALGSIGRTTGSLWRRARYRATWRFRSWVAWRVVLSNSFRHWPWPAQRLVRERLL